jgi:hypothetical protein
MIIIFWEMIIIIVTAVETSNLTYFVLHCEYISPLQISAFTCFSVSFNLSKNSLYFPLSISPLFVLLSLFILFWLP